MSTASLTHWCVFLQDKLLIKHLHNEIHLLSDIDMGHLLPHCLRQFTLPVEQPEHICCAELPVNFIVPDNIEALPLKIALEKLGDTWYENLAKAYAIITWDKNHQYCGRCGQQTMHPSQQFDRICPHCDLHFYPRISPSIIVLIERGEQLLMARGHFFLPGVHGLIAGFVEAGESIEAAVHREVREEIGIKIKNLKYFGSQAWPFPDSLMIGFFADYAEGELVINYEEIEHADWYPYNQLPGKSGSSISIARKMVNHFVAQHTFKS